jgi:hypothetical protein
LNNKLKKNIEYELDVMNQVAKRPGPPCQAFPEILHYPEEFPESVKSFNSEVVGCNPKGPSDENNAYIRKIKITEQDGDLLKTTIITVTEYCEEHPPVEDKVELCSL